MKTDIVIVGAGVIGMSLALSLSQRNKKILILERDMKKSHSTNRFYSISNKSKNFFKEIEVWSKFKFINEIKKMRIFYRSFEEKNSLNFHSGLQKIGFISQSADITSILYKKVMADKNIKLIDKVNLKSVIQRDENNYEIESSKSDIYSGDYIFSCEGTNSFIKDQINIKNSIKDYNSKAFVFNIQTENSNNNSAYQIFLKNGPIAFLPVSDNEFSIVISIRNKYDDSNIYFKENLPYYLDQITNGYFGKMNILGDVINFNLLGHNLKNYKYKNIMFVGDSAHSVHPLAGMGLNLGLSDVIEINKAFDSPIYEYGNNKFFDKYARNQKIINSHAKQQLELIERFYSIDNFFAKNLINFGMSVINKNDFFKKNITNHANQNLSFFN